MYDPGKHHRRSVRMHGADYSAEGWYFVTICTHNRVCSLGKISDGEVTLSEIGKAVEDMWRGLPERFPYVQLGTFVIMPNHLHGIITIIRPKSAKREVAEEVRAPEGTISYAESLSTIVRAFKSDATRRVRGMMGDPRYELWQRSYHEHIVRGAKQLTAIREYIYANPRHWARDETNPERVRQGAVQITDMELCASEERMLCASKYAQDNSGKDIIMADRYREEYELLAERLTDRGLDVNKIKARLKDQKIETPSWGYSNAGTRFGTFRQPGAAVTIEEKVADAAQVHKFTGVAPTVAVHVLWDFPNGLDDVQGLSAYAESLGVKIGAINPNVFQDRAYAFGSITNENPASRMKAVEHMLDSIEIGKVLNSEVLSLWFADGTDYPGQGDFRRRKAYAEESLKTVYNAMPESMRMVLEYKPFEPGFYHTDIADWGMAFVLCQKCGPRAQVLVDLGHHLQGTNVEHIVSFLLDEGKLGGFHFNNHKYADDDLTVGSVNPYELFLIYNELVKAEDAPNDNPTVAYMVDQCHIQKSKIDAMIQTIEHIQMAYAKALCINKSKLLVAQKSDDIVSAEMCMTEAFNTDVSPLLKVVREEMGIDPNPMDAFRASGYWNRMATERGDRKGSGGVGA